jgi:hypothetical protein
MFEWAKWQMMAFKLTLVGKEVRLRRYVRMEGGG